MIRRVRFALLAEGTSDHGLTTPLEELCIRCGADEVSSLVPNFARLDINVGKDVASRISALIENEPSVNLLFIHRDADSPNPAPRYSEISKAVRASNCNISYVAIVPIQETEAWLLLDEAEIRRVAQNPRSRTHLALPAPTQVERLSQPKEKLKELLSRASELRGRRLERFRNNFGRHRRLLLESLDIDGPIQQLSAWQQLHHATSEAIASLEEQP